LKEFIEFKIKIIKEILNELENVETEKTLNRKEELESELLQLKGGSERS